MSIQKIKSLAFSNQIENISLAIELMKSQGIKKIPVDLYQQLTDLGVRLEKNIDITPKDITNREYKNYNQDITLHLIAYLILQGVPCNIANNMVMGFEDEDGICEESIGGVLSFYDSAAVEWVIEMANDYNQNKFHAGFKYLHLIPYGDKVLSKAKKIFFDMLGLTNKKYIKGRNSKDNLVVYYNDSCTSFFQFETGRVCKGGYSGLYCTDFNEGLKLFEKIITAIDYVKSVDFAYNGKITMYTEKFPKKK